MVMPNALIVVAESTKAFSVERTDAAPYLAVDTVNDELEITGDLTLTGDLALTGDIALTGDLTQTGDVTITGDLAVSGHKQSQTMLFNSFNMLANWVNAIDGTARLPASETAQKFTIPISGLKVGDELVAFRIVGQIESAGATATLDADLRKVTKAAADVTDASVGAITQVSVAADTAVDAAKTLAAVTTVAADFQYYVLVTGTTAGSTDIAVIGIEVDLNRK